MGALVRSFDWSATSLGPLETWPASLTIATGIMLQSAVPMVMLWGKDGVLIYNDAYAQFAGGRHPRILGSKVREAWPEVADFNSNVMEVGLAGGTLAYRHQELTLHRNGRPEQVFMDLDYSPVPDETGMPGGVLAIVKETTEAVQTENALRRSEEQLRLATDAAEIGLWDVDLQLDTLYWTPRVRAMFGVSADVPVSLDDFYRGLHPDDFEATASAFAAAMDPETRALYDVEYRTIGKEDGIVRWVAAKGRGVFDRDGRCLRVLGTTLNITERKKAEAQLRELNATLEQRVAERTAERDRVWRNSRDLLIVVGRDGIFRAVNPAWTDILGHTPDEVINHSFMDFVWPEDLEISQQGLVTASSGNDLTNFETRYRHKDGQLRWISWHTSVEGDLVYCYGRDITAAKSQAAALAKAEEALRQAQKMEAIGQLTGGIAHDFNNLLQGVSGYFDLILRDVSNGQRVRQCAEAGLKSAGRGAALTAQLLAFSRSQKLEMKPVQLDELVVNMRHLLERTLGPTIFISLALEHDSIAVMADPTQLEMALLNLSINARDAMPSGGQLMVSTARRKIVSDPELSPGDYVELSVTDSGTGMSAEVLERAFDPFFTTKGIGKGTGLGLSQAYGMARQAGGTARICSAPGAGTTVSIFLRQSDVAPATDPSTPEVDEKAPQPAKTMTVLVIDDDADVRLFLCDSLEALGYSVLQAADGTAGLAVLQRTTPDVLVVDYAMPGLSGADVAREARARVPKLPIIFASGYAETLEIEKFAGPRTQMLRKPFQVRDLHKAIHEVVQADAGDS